MAQSCSREELSQVLNSSDSSGKSISFAKFSARKKVSRRHYCAFLYLIICNVLFFNGDTELHKLLLFYASLSEVMSILFFDASISHQYITLDNSPASQRQYIEPQR